MGKLLKNTGYFLREVRTIFFLNGFSGVLSAVSLTMIYFIALLGLTGWLVSAGLVEALRNEAEISVYTASALDEAGDKALTDEIQAVEGVMTVQRVSAEVSYERMSVILGPDAEILTHFDDNPFEAYYEVGIALEKLPGILEAIAALPQVEYVRDNKTILDKLEAITHAVSGLGIGIAAAVLVSTFIITSHIIREGVHAHRDQINTLKLLGAPDGFINGPFLLEGTLLSLAAGILSCVAYLLMARQFEGLLGDLLPFLPQMGLEGVRRGLLMGILPVSAGLGYAASLFGLRMVRMR